MLLSLRTSLSEGIPISQSRYKSESSCEAATLSQESGVDYKTSPMNEGVFIAFYCVMTAVLKISVEAAQMS